MLSEEEKKAIENLKDFKSISILYGNKFVMFLEQLKKYQESTDTILNLVTKLQKENENSISKDIIRDKINERQFELQQEYKDIKDDIRLNTLQEIYYSKGEKDEKNRRI